MFTYVVKVNHQRHKIISHIHFHRVLIKMIGLHVMLVKKRKRNMK